MARNSTFRLNLLLAGGAIPTLLGSPAVQAESAAAVANAPGTVQTTSEPDSGGLLLQEVVVTATPAPQRKFDAAYAISTMDSDMIRQRAPRSMVDLLRSTPGVTVENSGGEGGGENVVIRGLPFAGFRLLDVLEDGLPLFESNFERELNIDEVYRVDLNTTGVELVRGGTAPIYSNNASGGVVNFITNHGTSTPEREVKVTAGPNGLARLDSVVSGPMTDNVLYSVGGFFRRDNGLRNPGFDGANLGGQFKAGVTYLLDHGKLFADVKYLNDRSIFYSDIPLLDPRTGATLSGLINPNTGTLDSNSFRRAQILTLNGSGGGQALSRDLRDGIHPDIKTVTIGGDYDLGAGWTVSDKARYTDGSVGFDGLFNGAPADAAVNLSSYLSKAQTAFAGTTSLRYVYAGTNNVFNPASTAGLTMTNTWMSNRTTYTDALNDLRVNKSVDSSTFGKHDLTLGFSLSRFTMTQQQLGNTILTNVKNNPDALDIQALDAGGNVLGLLTQNGFTTYGSGDLIGNVHGLATAVYAAENWHITDDWQVDAGVRHQSRTEHGERGALGAQTLNTTGPLAARSVTGLVSYIPYSKGYHETSWTVGSLYQFSKSMNAFVRYSDTFSLPRFSDQWANINNGVAGTLPNGRQVPVTPIKQAETGLKLSVPHLQVFAIGFWSHFDALNTSTYVADANGVLSNQALLINTVTKGVELEAAWRPVRFFELDGSFTWQDPVIDSATTFNTISAASLSNKLIPRVPRQSLTLEPAYLFDIGARHGRLFGTLYTVSKRYQDFVNTSVLPAYTTFDAGISLQATHSMSFEILGTNLTNSTGLTEGNARAPISNVLTVGNATVGRPIFGRTWTASVTASF
ncbi:MAG: TonB-dependent receptor domain-containing protein [Steroidobacteraceae bacterium]